MDTQEEGGGRYEQEGGDLCAILVHCKCQCNKHLITVIHALAVHITE